MTGVMDNIEWCMTLADIHHLITAKPTSGGLPMAAKPFILTVDRLPRVGYSRCQFFLKESQQSIEFYQSMFYNDKIGHEKNVSSKLL